MSLYLTQQGRICHRGIWEIPGGPVGIWGRSLQNLINERKMED